MFQYTPLFCAGRYLKEIITPFLAAGCIVLAIGAVAKGDVPLTFTEMATDLDEPWSFGFLPDGGYLVTLRGGQLRRYDAGGAFDIVSGLPDIAVQGQGGLLDVLVPSDFADTQQIYFTYSTSQAHGGAGTALARAVLRGNALHDMQILWQLTPGSSGGRHFGSRIIEGQDGYLYVTIGDRGDRGSAQDLGNENGTLIRLTRDGRIPANNPFVGHDGAQGAIWSYGHRNPQGAAMDGQGRIWVVEHGARGGDEVNLIRPGANYGWPVIAYGRHYSGAPIGIGTQAEGMQQPYFYWDPSIAPSGAAFYQGDLFPDWQGDMLVGALSGGVIRLRPGPNMHEIGRIETHETARVRDVRVAPDGAIWVLSVGNGALYRITPASQ